MSGVAIVHLYNQSLNIFKNKIKGHLLQEAFPRLHHDLCRRPSSMLPDSLTHMETSRLLVQTIKGLNHSLAVSALSKVP